MSKRLGAKNKIIVEINNMRMELDALLLGIEILSTYVQKRKMPWQIQYIASLRKRADILRGRLDELWQLATRWYNGDECTKE